MELEIGGVVLTIELDSAEKLALAILAFAILLLVVVAIANRIRISAPLLLIIVGIGLSFVIAEIPPLPPELVLVGILPPLLYGAAYNTSFIDFRNKKWSIGSLSVGLVIFTSLIVGAVAHLVIPDIPLAAGIALGAVVAPPDAVAATAVAKRVGMPTSVVQILEGESLVNDASALTTLRAAIITVSATFSLWQVSFNFIIAAGGGVLLGYLVAQIAIPIRRRITTPTFDTIFSFTVPFLAFLPAEFIDASGVVAVVVAGLLVGHGSPGVQTGSARLTTQANWRTLIFFLENAVFLLVGLQMRNVLEGLGADNHTTPDVIFFTVSIYLALVITRFVWMFIPWLPASLRNKRSGTRERVVIAWAGMRGVVTLAAALTLPAGFPSRDLLIFVSFVVVLASLMIQGFTLPALVRYLRLSPPDPASMALEEASLLERAANAGTKRLGEVVTPADPAEVVERLRLGARERTNAAWEKVAEPGGEETPIEAYSRLRLVMLHAERTSVLEDRDSGNYSDEIIRQVINLLDVEEARLDAIRVTRSEGARDVAVPETVAGECGHLTDAKSLPVPPPPLECEACIAEGSTWVHLRMCLECGTVGCCDSSERLHARQHHRDTKHAVIRSVEPGEDWRWCYIDHLLDNTPVDAPRRPS